MAQIVAVVLIAGAVFGVWYLGARYVSVLAGQRDQDEAYWFRAGLMITPVLALLLLVLTTPSPGRRR